MADALCGPSNALQSFQKHAQQDRTLQQDRLVSRPGASQSFRSPDSSQGLLDPEFEAFQAGHPTPAAPLHPSAFQQHSLPIPRQNQLSFNAPQPVAPDWALDFQRMNLSSAGPSMSQNVFQAPSAVSTAPGPSTLMTSQPTYSPMLETPFQYGQMSSAFGTGMGMGMSYNMNMDMQNQDQALAMATHDPVFDTAAFEHAFDLAAAEMLQSDRELDELLSLAAGKEIDHEDAQRSDLVESISHKSVLTFDERVKQEAQLTPTQNSDALAETAGQLLENISHETSDKFAQSAFLALMRRLRDREVKVEGEDFIESSTNQIANTTGMASSTIDFTPEPESLRIPPHEQDDDLGRHDSVETMEAVGEF